MAPARRPGACALRQTGAWSPFDAKSRINTLRTSVTFMHHVNKLTNVLLNRLFLFFIHLKLELLTQFPDSNDKNIFYLSKIDHNSNIELLN